MKAKPFSIWAIPLNLPLQPKPRLRNHRRPTPSLGSWQSHFGQSLAFKKGQTVCELAEACGLSINAECHSGICGSDPIRIISGKEHLNEIGAAEREALEDICGLEPGEYRLACMAAPAGSVEVEILES